MATPTSQTGRILRRYTDVPALLALLQNKALTLLSPSLWEDRNDAFYMSQYKSRKQLKTLLALCFTENDETSHHWRVFTRGSEGVCIHFKKKALLDGLHDSIIAKTVEYRMIKDLSGHPPTVDELPFLKRYPYSDERELRLIYEDARNEIETKSFSIPIGCIDRVTLNPWLAPPLAGAVKAAIKATPGCSALKVYQTTLLENETWKKAALRSR
jgi:hypothetical protein